MGWYTEWNRKYITGLERQLQDIELSHNTPPSTLPAFMKASAAEVKPTTRTSAYTAGYGQGFLLGATVVTASQGRYGVSAIFATLSLFPTLYHARRGARLRAEQSAIPSASIPK